MGADPLSAAAIGAFLTENALPLALSGGGALLQNQAARQQASDRRNTLNRQLARDEAATNKSIDLTQTEAKRYDPAARQQALAEQEGKTYEQAQADIAGAGGAMIPTAGDAGNVSQDFITSKAQKAIDEGSRLTSIAREVAKSRAPIQLGGVDALSRANLAGNLQNTWGTNNNMARATGMDAQNIDEPGYGGLGSIASAVGTGMLAGGGMKKTPWQSSINWSDPMRAGAFR